MHFRGAPSWQFGHGDMGYLHTALFVRDAARLPVPPSADIPPRLSGEVPDHADVLPLAERVAAGQEWTEWWQRLVGQTVREARQSVTPLPAGTDPDDFEARMRHRFGGREDVFDPPDFESLADVQPLHSAVTATFKFCGQWSISRPEHAPPLEREFASPLVRAAAESIAADLGVPINDLVGYANVLDVRGAVVASSRTGLRAVFARSRVRPDGQCPVAARSLQLGTPPRIAAPHNLPHITP